MIPLCLDQGRRRHPWSPLARGFLAGNRTARRASGTRYGRAATRSATRSTPSADFDVVDQLLDVARGRGLAAGPGGAGLAAAQAGRHRADRGRVEADPPR